MWLKQAKNMHTKTICIARHGETDWNKLGILQGWLDVPINQLGRDQARQWAADWVTAGFSAVWTSPLARALETADIIASVLQLPPPFCHEGLKERNFGAIQGIPKNELAELNPALMEQIVRRNPAAEFVGGETMDEFAGRVLSAVSDIAASDNGNRVLVITHGWVLDVITRHINGLARHVVLSRKPKNGDTVWIQSCDGVIGAVPTNTQ